MACDQARTFAALAAISAVAVHSCAPSGAVSVFAMHGTQDTVALFSGGIGYGGVEYPPFETVMQAWAKANSCAAIGSTQKTDAYLQYAYKPCGGGTSVVYYEVIEGTHGWFDQPAATQLLWTFLLGQAKNG